MYVLMDTKKTDGFAWVEWLIAERLKHEWSQSDLARKAGTLPLDEYTRRISTLETALLQLEGKQADSGEALTRHAQQLALIGGLLGILESVPDYLLTAPPQEVNTQLCQLLEKITLTPDTVTLTFLK